MFRLLQPSIDLNLLGKKNDFLCLVTLGGLERTLGQRRLAASAKAGQAQRSSVLHLKDGARTPGKLVMFCHG